jgi:hypothetical protein
MFEAGQIMLTAVARQECMKGLDDNAEVRARS